MLKYFALLAAGFIAYVVVPHPAMDLYRYYESASSFNLDQSLVEFVSDWFSSNFDFIYFSSFFLARKAGLPVEVVTAVFVGIFVYQVVRILEFVSETYPMSRSGKLLVPAFALASASIVLLLMISRNVAALAVFFIGVNWLLREKFVRAAIYFLLAVFTHVGLIVYILLFVVSYFVPWLRISSRSRRNAFLLLGSVLFFYSGDLLNSVFGTFSGLSFFTDYARYADYLVQDSDIFSDLAYYDVLPIVFSFGVLVYGLMLVRNFTALLWVAFYSCFALAASLGTSTMFSQRTVLFLVPFQGVVALSILRERAIGLRGMFFYKSLLFVGFLLYAINIYSYREFIFLA
jgi:hypothetical protein